MIVLAGQEPCVAAGLAEGPATRRSLGVPHPLELRHTGPDAVEHARASRLRRDEAPPSWGPRRPGPGPTQANRLISQGFEEKSHVSV